MLRCVVVVVDCGEEEEVGGGQRRGEEGWSLEVRVSIVRVRALVLQT